MITNNHFEIGKPITDKRIINFMMRKMKFWEPITYGGKVYILTFQNNVYQKEVK